MNNNIIEFKVKSEVSRIKMKDEAMANLFGISLATFLNSYKGPTVKRNIKQYSKDFDGTLPDDEVIALLGCVTRRSYFKYKRSLKKALENV